MDAALVLTIIGAAGANVSALTVAWLNLRGKSIDQLREIRGNTRRLETIESEVRGIRSDLSTQNGSIRVLQTEVHHLNDWRVTLDKRCDAHLNRITKVERQVNGDD